MKISINFYVDELKPTKDYLTLNNVAIASGVITLFMVIWLGIIHFNIMQVNDELAVVEQQSKKAQNLLTKLQKDLIKHNDKATLNNQKMMLDKKLKAKKRLWEGVGKRLENKTVDYYLVLKELTEHHDHDLWLSKFIFNEKSAQFHGFALDSSAVTRWMTYLQSSQSFTGLEFSHLNLASVDDELIQFEVATSIDVLQKVDAK